MKTIIFSLYSYSYYAFCEWVAVWGILRTCAVGAENEVPDTVSYSEADMRSLIILFLPPPNVVNMAAPLA